MGKIIRRTITITVTETWTFVWTPDDAPPGHPVTLIPHPVGTEEEANENLQATLTAAEMDKSGAIDPPSTPPVPDASHDSWPGSAPNHVTTGRKRKRAPRRTRSDL